MTTNLRAAARITVDGWTVDVEHDGQVGDLTHGIRNAWRWEISRLDGDELSMWEGADLTSAIDLRDPDPIAALCSLGSFLGAYAEAWQYGTERSENRGLFPATLPADVAGTIADAIALEWPEGEPETCAACGDPFDRAHGNLAPVWSDAHDNMIHWICQPQPVDPGCGSTPED